MDDVEREPAGSGTDGTKRQVLAFVALAVLAGVALPASASIVEAVSDRAENWIFVLQFALVFVAAAAFSLRPSADRSPRRSLVIAFAAAVAAMLVADAVWLFGMAG